MNPNHPCPCSSGRKYKKCCRPFHRGAPAPTPEALMRSRYSAYALGEVDYIMATTDPETVPEHAGWRAEIEAFCQHTDFEGLEVIASEGKHVSFRALLRQAGRDASFGERSRFRRVDGRWVYTDGERP